MDFRSASTHALVAHLVSMKDVEAKSCALLAHILTPLGERVFEDHDPRKQLLVPRLPVAVQQHPALVGNVHSKRQRQLSRIVMETQRATLSASMDDVDRARTSSASAPFSGVWIAPVHAWKGSWLNDVEFTTAMRNRLGLAQQSAPIRCTICNTGIISDVRGHHSQACMFGGNRTRLHNAMRDNSVHFMSAALWTPLRERCPFPADPALRVDILTSCGMAREFGCDQAVISTFAHMQQAIASPGGASDHYAEHAKLRDTYGHVRDDPRVEPVPLVVDTLGAWNARALTLFRMLARQYATQFGCAPAVAMTKIMTAHAVRLQRGVAELIGFNRLAAMGAPAT